MLSNVFDTECSLLLFVGLDPKLCLASSGFYPIVPQDRFAYILVLMTTQSQTNWPKESVSASLTKASQPPRAKGGLYWLDGKNRLIFCLFVGVIDLH